MQLSKILLPTDFSARSAGAAHYAKALACRFRSELIVAHVFEVREALVNVPEAGVPPNWYEDRRAEIRSALENFQAVEFRTLPVERVILEGDPAHAIVELAHSEQADLVVMPSHGYGRFRRFILGSVTAKILHDADCPVLTGVHLDETPSAAPVFFQSVVCAADFDAAGERALDWAAGFAKEFHARLTLVHALPALPITEAVDYDQTLPKMFRDVAQQNAAEMQKRLGTKAAVVLECGPVPEVVHRAAVAERADLVVIGRHETAGLLGRLRANAYEIVRRSPCPVVSV